MQQCGVIIDATDDGKYDVPLPIQHETASTIMPETWVKAAGVIRANSLIRGHSAVRWVLLERLEQILQNNIVPLVPMRGSISASGGGVFSHCRHHIVFHVFFATDLSPLSYIAGALTGNPAIKVYDGPQDNRRICSSVDALASHNIPPLDFYPKEELGLLNGE
jgi:phenylalanine ammonia-lyase